MARACSSKTNTRKRLAELYAVVRACEVMVEDASSKRAPATQPAPPPQVRAPNVAPHLEVPKTQVLAPPPQQPIEGAGPIKQGPSKANARKRRENRLDKLEIIIRAALAEIQDLRMADSPSSQGTGADPCLDVGPGSRTLELGQLSAAAQPQPSTRLGTPSCDQGSPAKPAVAPNAGPSTHASDEQMCSVGKSMGNADNLEVRGRGSPGKLGSPMPLQPIGPAKTNKHAKRVVYATSPLARKSPLSRKKNMVRGSPKRVGRQRAKIDYALPSLRTKMRR